MFPLPVSFLYQVETGAGGREPDEAHVREEQTAVQKKWWPPAYAATNGGETKDPEPRECWDGEWVWRLLVVQTLLRVFKDCATFTKTNGWPLLAIKGKAWSNTSVQKMSLRRRKHPALGRPRSNSPFRHHWSGPAPWQTWVTPTRSRKWSFSSCRSLNNVASLMSSRRSGIYSTRIRYLMNRLNIVT